MVLSQKHSGPSFTTRALIAIGLMGGFYLLAISILGVLLYIPYAEWHYVHRIHLKLTIVCVIGAYAILKGFFFISAPFTPPGPEVSEKEEPRLFNIIRQVSEKLKTKMPDAVYFIPDVNAFVTEVGGFMGIATRRVMGIGIGLLVVDTVGGFKATIAHEFGHYMGGDTRLGGFIYRVREAMIRVLANLGDSWLAKPFEWYARLFLRITHSISRQQELAADRVSVELAGKEAHLEGLRRETKALYLYSAFMDSEVEPIVEEGRFPKNLYNGLRIFMKHNHEGELARKLEKAIMEIKTDPYDTHPSLSERISYAETLEDPGVPEEPENALSLIEKPQKVEEDVTGYLCSNIPSEKRLCPIDWDVVVPEIFIPRVKVNANNNLKLIATSFGQDKGSSFSNALSTLLEEISKGDLVTLTEKIIGQKAPQDMDKEEIENMAKSYLTNIFGMIMGAAIVEKGGQWQTDIGKNLSVSYQGADCEIFTWVGEVIQNPSRITDLRKKLSELGIISPGKENP